MDETAQVPPLDYFFPENLIKKKKGIRHRERSQQSSQQAAQKASDHTSITEGERRVDSFWIEQAARQGVDTRSTSQSSRRPDPSTGRGRAYDNLLLLLLLLYVRRRTASNTAWAQEGHSFEKQTFERSEHGPRTAYSSSFIL